LVLFADLVGFITLSEHRDPEAVRELLSQYFDRCRALIERYGGTVEKFIVDAVIAVWGTPVAREDDAERAVRAALSLTGAETALGEELGIPELRVRAGVLTGSAAVEVGTEGEGMVLGDTVNTAWRLQSITAPGAVLVDDVTRCPARRRRRHRALTQWGRVGIGGVAIARCRAPDESRLTSSS
jgi:class 3 adenylate cyclase